MRDLEFTKNEKAELIYDVVAGIMAGIAVLIVMMGRTEEDKSEIQSLTKIVWRLLL
ncbi:hypothetical protein [Clostridium butyricum]|uniref:hypothetical protein n=1 Tax=Clostridium butyricum TaxID=1492 RepID=UPI002102EB8E|nr:hypothetical protein [Clostridium butyricum]MCQ2023586.1 hypothetical protein [Clostridium butyricum]